MDNLDSQRIIDTIVILCKRINERFPKSGLSNLCLELRTIAEESTSRCKWIEKPHWLLRIGIGFIIILLIFTLLILIRSTVSFSASYDLKLVDFLQILDAGMNSIILISAALLFVITVEIRRKRQRAIKAIHQLRVLAHVIDMYQLTKDPERIVRNRNQSTSSSPRETMTAFELTRYLTYCSEMLSLVGKIAALYVQGFQDAIVLEAVNDVETLTTGLSQKIWQKILILHRLTEQSSTTTTTTPSKSK